MRRPEANPPYPDEVTRRAEKDMLSPQEYLSRLIRLKQFFGLIGNDKAFLIRIDRMQGGIYFEVPDEDEDVVKTANELNQVVAPITDGDRWLEEFIAVTINGELLSKKAQRKNVTNSR